VIRLPPEQRTLLLLPRTQVPLPSGFWSRAEPPGSVAPPDPVYPNSTRAPRPALLMGHGSPAVLQRYLALADEDMESAQITLAG